MPLQDSTYTYSSQPHSAPTKTSKHYRNANNELPQGVPLTLMSDPRVVRGITHTLAKKISKSKDDTLHSTAHHKLSRTKLQDEVERSSQPYYNYTVKKFSTTEIDVTDYLIERNDYPTRTREIDIQTNAFEPIIRPPTPEWRQYEGSYVPRKTGVDKATQVEDVRDLFNFDLEVVPILDIIVSKTLKQALFEVQSEEELHCLEVAITDFHEQKKKEKEWIKQKEHEVKAQVINTKVLIQSIQAAKEEEIATRTLVAGLNMMQQIIPEVINEIYSSFFKNGDWIEPDVAAAESEVVPGILHKAGYASEAYNSAQVVIDGKFLLFVD